LGHRMTKRKFRTQLSNASFPIRPSDCAPLSISTKINCRTILPDCDSHNSPSAASGAWAVRSDATWTIRFLSFWICDVTSDTHFGFKSFPHCPPLQEFCETQKNRIPIDFNVLSQNACSLIGPSAEPLSNLIDSSDLPSGKLRLLKTTTSEGITIEGQDP
jgi:hypothetical protein